MVAPLCIGPKILPEDIRKKKYFQNEKHDKKFDQDNQP